jgi:NAD(P)-dependent dehydrogenase (short-subunit alcohol dehydrogenase family)
MLGAEGAPMELSGRVAVVTGAGSGIGRAIALELSRLGAAVGLIGRTRATLDAVAGEAKGEAFVATADVRQRASVDAALDAVRARLGPLHVVVANAGVGGPNDLGDGRDRWDEIVRTNLDGAYFTLRAFERNLAPPASWRHAIVISSCVARFGVPGISAYSAAKAGQLGLVRSLAVELAPKRVLVNAICPGWVETQMAIDRMTEIGAGQGKGYAEVRRELLAGVPLQRISEPEEVAGLVSFLLSPAATAFTGQAFDLNNGAWMG